MSFAYSGAYANILVNSVDADVSGWGLDLGGSSFDSTTTADAGWEDMTWATNNANGSFDFLYNPKKKPTGSTLTLMPGTVITLLTLYINEPGGDSFSGAALITKLSLKAKVKDGIIVSATFVSKGKWTVPGP